MDLRIELLTAPSYEARALIKELEAYLAGLYLPEQLHGWSYERMMQHDVKFFLAKNGPRAVGCGGIALFDGFAEVKRMYTIQDARGQGVGEAILARLEQEAKALGKKWLLLETGHGQEESLRFFEDNGFSPRRGFGDYMGMRPLTLATSRFYEKLLLP